MSYVFDNIERIYIEEIYKHIPDEKTAMLFNNILHSIHNANHKVPSSDGIFKGDGLNHDDQLRRDTDRLIKYLEEKQSKPT